LLGGGFHGLEMQSITVRLPIRNRIGTESLDALHAFLEAVIVKVKVLTLAKRRGPCLNQPSHDPGR
jgi:hypothetical protein